MGRISAALQSHLSYQSSYLTSSISSPFITIHSHSRYWPLTDRFSIQPLACHILTLFLATALLIHGLPLILNPHRAKQHRKHSLGDEHGVSNHPTLSASNRTDTFPCELYLMGETNEELSYYIKKVSCYYYCCCRRRGRQNLEKCTEVENSSELQSPNI